ncbi:MAG: hypothetical protein H7X94_10820, partial [Vallitaleaceae bacterium]|nr:hypothetical protein [Vallitaleaceae bacterium]
IKYTLTEHGIIRKASLYYDWIVQSYHTISKTKFHIKGIVEKQISKGVNSFILFGLEDEIFKLVKMCLMELKREHTIHYHHLTDLSPLDQMEAFCLLHWDIKALFDERLNAINVLFE